MHRDYQSCVIWDRVYGIRPRERPRVLWYEIIGHIRIYVNRNKMTRILCNLHQICLIECQNHYDKPARNNAIIKGDRFIWSCDIRMCERRARRLQLKRRDMGLHSMKSRSIVETIIYFLCELVPLKNSNDYVRHQGEKTSKYVSICLKSLQRMSG